MGDLLTMTFIPGLIQEIKANQQLVIIIASLEALLFVFLILFLAGKNRRRQRNFNEELADFMEAGDALGVQMVNLDTRVEQLVMQVKSVLTRLTNIEEHLHNITGSNASFPGASFPKSQPEVLKLYESIYRAYDSGVKVNDLSRKFGRSNGEIELILNIRKEQLR